MNQLNLFHNNFKQKYFMQNSQKMYVIKSTQQGVNIPMTREIIRIDKNIGRRYEDDSVKKIDRYVLDKSCFPYEIDICEGEFSSLDEGYGSGVGDLWQWSFFATISKEICDKYYIEECLRVKNKYSNS